jgi:predicted aspartyl protease
MPFLTISNSSLIQLGPTIEVLICPPQSLSQLLKSQGKQVPAFKATALIDTGASSTCISKEIVEYLGLISFDAQEVHTAGGLSEQLLYDIGVGLPISQPNILGVQAPCADLTGQPFHVLLGRDILSQCSLFYNGKENSFVLHY